MHNHARPTRITALTFLIMALTTLALTLSIPPSAGHATTVSAAEDDLPSETRHTIAMDVRLTEQGQVTVREEHTWEFASTPPRTLGRALERFTPYTNDEWRRLEYTNFHTESDSVDLTHSVLDDGNTLHVTITPVDASLPHTLTLTLSYTVEGTLTFARTGDYPGDHEFFWPVLTTDRYTPHVSVTVHGPLAPTTAHCDFVPPDNWEELATTDDTTTADPVMCTSLGHNTPTLTLSNAVESTTMAVAVTWPPGTYTRLGVNDIDVDPTPTNDDTEAPEFDPTWTENIDQQIPGSSPWPMILIVTAIAGGLIVTLIAATRRRPDQRCAQAPAGDVTWVADHPGAPITTTYDLPTGPRRATPPPGITVAVAGALMSKELRARDVTGMLLTLAHRGHIHMSKSSPGWTLTRLSPNDPVTTAEQALLDAFFAHTDTVHLTSIAEQLAPQFLEVLRAIGQDTADLGVLRQDLDHEALAKAHRKQRTPHGRAYAEALAGFGDYLRDPQPPTSLTGAGFYEFLPWAVVLGAVPAWAEAHDTAGVPFTDPEWFTTNSSTFREFIDALNELAQTSF